MYLQFLSKDGKYTIAQSASDLDFELNKTLTVAILKYILDIMTLTFRINKKNNNINNR